MLHGSTTAYSRIRLLKQALSLSWSVSKPIHLVAAGTPPDPLPVRFDASALSRISLIAAANASGLTPASQRAKISSIDFRSNPELSKLAISSRAAEQTQQCDRIMFVNVPNGLVRDARSSKGFTEPCTRPQHLNAGYLVGLTPNNFFAFRMKQAWSLCHCCKRLCAAAAQLDPPELPRKHHNRHSATGGGGSTLPIGKSNHGRVDLSGTHTRRGGDHCRRNRL